MAIDPTSRAAKALRDTVLKDAQAWWDRGPREFVRSKTTSLRVAQRNELDDIFTAQNQDWDESMKDFYESRYVRYGGDLNDLPWIEADERIKQDADA